MRGGGSGVSGGDCGGSGGGGDDSGRGRVVIVSLVFVVVYVGIFWEVNYQPPIT